MKNSHSGARAQPFAQTKPSTATSTSLLSAVSHCGVAVLATRTNGRELQQKILLG